MLDIIVNFQTISPTGPFLLVSLISTSVHWTESTTEIVFECRRQ